MFTYKTLRYIQIKKNCNGYKVKINLLAFMCDVYFFYFITSELYRKHTKDTFSITR